jgi:hypothetical protein
LNNLMTLWAEGFRAIYPNVNIQIEGKGSSTAPPAGPNRPTPVPPPACRSAVVAPSVEHPAPTPGPLPERHNRRTCTPQSRRDLRIGLPHIGQQQDPGPGHFPGLPDSPVQKGLQGGTVRIG